MIKFNCQQAQDNLSPYLDNELAPDVVSMLEAHLAICPECSAELQHWRQLSAVMRGLAGDQVTAPAGLRQNILNALQHEDTRTAAIAQPAAQKSGTPARTFMARSRQWLAVAAAALVFTFGSWSAGLHLFDNAGEKQQLAEQIDTSGNAGNNPAEPGDNTPAVTDGTPGPNDADQNPTGETPGQGVPGNNGPIDSQGNGDGQPGRENSSDSGAGKPNQQQPNGGSSEETTTPGDAVMLMAENMNATSTSVWLESNEPGPTTEQLKEIADSVGATFNQTLIDPSLGGSIVTIKVSPGKYEGTLDQVKKSGTVSDIKSEKINLGDQYLSAYKRMQELHSSLAADPENQDQIQAQLQDAENLVNSIEAQSRKNTITVWLNTNH